MTDPGLHLEPAGPLDRFQPGGSDWLSRIRDIMAPGASDDELAYFGAVCARLDLSPFADQIVLIGRTDNRLDPPRKVFRHQITVAGRRTLASRTGKIAGIEGPMWCGPREDNGGDLVWRDVWDDDDNYPYCARVLVYVHGWNRPANGTAKWSENVQYADRERTRIAPLWYRMPSHMLGKVAESLALRRAFPDVIPAALAGFGAGDPVDEAEVEHRRLEP